MNLRKFDKYKDKEFIEQCLSSDEYRNFISKDDDFNKILNNNIIIIEDKKKYGFLDLQEIDYTNNNVCLNIYMAFKSSIINAKAMFNSIRYLIEDLGFHKVIMKVDSQNAVMINILDRLNIFKEGIIYDVIQSPGSNVKNIHIYSIIDWEYENIKEYIKKEFR